MPINLRWILAAVAATTLHAHAGTCTVKSPPTVTPLVELYTSEGCSSCPPADRWLSTLKGRPDVVALAFHVDYWDRLGWTDRFASPMFTQRQYEQLAVNGSRFAYTPQVVVNGRDQKSWPRTRVVASPEASPVSIELTRDDADRLLAKVSPVGDAPMRLAAFWAVTESGHRTSVKAGENEGATLEHDFVVRDYERVQAWTGTRAQPATLSHSIRLPQDAGRERRASLVVVDATSGRPLQAVTLSCP